MRSSGLWNKPLKFHAFSEGSSSVSANPLARYLQKLPRQSRAIVLTCFYGVGAGLVAVLFHEAISFVYEQGLGRLAEVSVGTFLLGSFPIMMGTSLVAGWLLNSFCYDARGSGIPQLKVAFWKDFGYVPWRVVWVKFVAGVLSVGGGCSLGREGPSVQLAGGLASNMAGVLGEPKQNRRAAAAAGAAAGLAAAFNTPLAAVTFVLEEIIADLNSRFLGGVLLASLLGAFTVHALIGKQPAFVLGGVGAPGWHVYLLIPVVSAVAGIIGVFFQKMTMGLRQKRKSFEHVPGWARPAIGGFITWALGGAVFYFTGRLGVFSLGYNDLSDALSHNLTWQIALVLLGTKLIATVCCYGFGGCGGIFAPTLFFGGVCGAALAQVIGLAVPLGSADMVVLAVVGMSSCLGAVVRAPVRGILIVFEMTHEFSIVPALMLGALVSEAISRRYLKHNFYEEILLQDGHNLDHVIPPRDLQTWQQLPVSAIANFQPVVISNLAPAALGQTLKAYPYLCFPVVQEGRLVGALTRKEAEESLAEQRAPRLEPVSTCPPTHSIRRLQNLLIESPTGMVVLLEKTDGKVLGLVTLHDLLRAEVSIAKEGD